MYDERDRERERLSHWRTVGWMTLSHTAHPKATEVWREKEFRSVGRWLRRRLYSLAHSESSVHLRAIFILTVSRSQTWGVNWRRWGSSLEGKIDANWNQFQFILRRFLQALNAFVFTSSKRFNLWRKNELVVVCRLLINLLACLSSLFLFSLFSSTVTLTLYQSHLT